MRTIISFLLGMLSPLFVLALVLGFILNQDSAIDSPMPIETPAIVQDETPHVWNRGNICDSPFYDYCERVIIYNDYYERVTWDKDNGVSIVRYNLDSVPMTNVTESR